MKIMKTGDPACNDDNLEPIEAGRPTQVWYRLTHELGPGALPDDVVIIDMEEDKYHDLVLLDRPLTAREMEYYDITEDYSHNKQSKFNLGKFIPTRRAIASSTDVDDPMYSILEAIAEDNDYEAYTFEELKNVLHDVYDIDGETEELYDKYNEIRNKQYSASDYFTKDDLLDLMDEVSEQTGLNVYDGYIVDYNRVVLDARDFEDEYEYSAQYTIDMDEFLDNDLNLVDYADEFVAQLIDEMQRIQDNNIEY